MRLSFFALFALFCSNVCSNCSLSAAEPWYHYSSPWRTPVGDDPVVIDDPAYYVDGDPAKGMKAFHGLTLTSDRSQYTYPVHYVDSSMPLVQIGFDGNFSQVHDDDGDGDEDRSTRTLWSKGTYRTHLDPSARYEIPAGSDAQFVFINRDTGEEFAVWQAKDLDGDGLWEPWDGERVTSGYSYNLAWSGYPPINPNNGLEQFLSRGAGVPYGVGLIRRAEIEAGRIEHAIALAFPRNHDTAFIFPATKTDGHKMPRDGDLGQTLAEGQLVQLDPAFRQTREYQLLPRAARIIADALIDYGAYVIDNSGSTKLIAEHESTARWDELPADLRVDRNTVSGIPLAWFRPIASPHAFNTQVQGVHDYADRVPEPEPWERRVAELERMAAEFEARIEELEATVDKVRDALE